MSNERLDRHDKIHHELFDEDTAPVNSLGDIVEAHAGDAVFFSPAERGVGGADGGLSDMEAEMNATDPAFDETLDPDDLYSAADEGQVWGADQTGTVAGIARGFGTHLPQDFGKDGFQVEEIPDAALQHRSRPLKDGEELDDYDDPDDTEGQYDSSADLAHASEPGVNRVTRSDANDGEPTPDRIPIRSQPRPQTTDEQLDATREIT